MRSEFYNYCHRHSNKSRVKDNILPDLSKRYYATNHASRDLLLSQTERHYNRGGIIVNKKPANHADYQALRLHRAEVE